MLSCWVCSLALYFKFDLSIDPFRENRIGGMVDKGSMAYLNIMGEYSGLPLGDKHERDLLNVIPE